MAVVVPTIDDLGVAEIETQQQRATVAALDQRGASSSTAMRRSSTSSTSKPDGRRDAAGDEPGDTYQPRVGRKHELDPSVIVLVVHDRVLP